MAGIDPSEQSDGSHNIQRPVTINSLAAYAATIN